MSALCAEEFRRDLSSEAALLRVTKPTMDERGTWINRPAVLIDGEDKRVLRATQPIRSAVMAGMIRLNTEHEDQNHGR